MVAEYDETADGLQNWRKTPFARAVAIGFILIILLGNVWLIYALMGRPAPVWTGLGFLFASGVIAISGVGLLTRLIKSRLGK